jgi:hypothetical protein
MVSGCRVAREDINVCGDTDLTWRRVYGNTGVACVVVEVHVEM